MLLRAQVLDWHWVPYHLLMLEELERDQCMRGLLMLSTLVKRRSRPKGERSK
jgi:hypothetical protein